jgi:hypothetical protein
VGGEVLDRPGAHGGEGQVEAAGHDLHLVYETKANLTRAQVDLLRAAGVGWIQPGLESLSTLILKLMRKLDEADGRA